MTLEERNDDLNVHFHDHQFLSIHVKYGLQLTSIDKEKPVQVLKLNSQTCWGII